MNFYRLIYIWMKLTVSVRLDLVDVALLTISDLILLMLMS